MTSRDRALLATVFHLLERISDRLGPHSSRATHNLLHNCSSRNFLLYPSKLHYITLMAQSQ